jgi:serine/threonine-protein kinase
MLVTLTVTAGPHEGRVFSFAEHDTFVVGRSKRAHFRLATKDKYFSRFHFLVEVNPPHCRLLDMGSRNGTAVNGVKVKSADLRDGDQIQAGRTVLRVRVEPGPSALPVAIPEPVPPGQESAVRALPMASVRTVFPPGNVAAAPSTVPYQPEPGRTGTIACLVCAAPAVPGGPLCPSCRGQAQGNPQPIPGYEIVRELGRGGMGIVSLAVHAASWTLAAVKTIRPAVSGTAADVERFLREARILGSLQHPHIVAFREMGEADGKLYFAMDYVRGQDAGQLLKAEGPLAVGRAVRLMCQVLEALEYAHRRGFVHRDIKPRNILVTGRDGQEAAKLADFGLARAYQSSKLSGLTLTGDVNGTPNFLPPEQITECRYARPAADQYATAAALYNLLTGCFLFDGARGLNELLPLILSTEPVPLRSRRADIPEGLTAIVHRALAKDSSDRYPDADALRRALAPFAGRP